MAFGLPMVERMGADVASGAMQLTRGRAPRMLVMAPTRELARQVNEEVGNVARAHRLSSAVFHGGAAYGPQEAALRNGPQTFLSMSCVVPLVLRAGRGTVSSL
jgi:ATP-dependent RNA helicase DDX21